MNIDQIIDKEGNLNPNLNENQAMDIFMAIKAAYPREIFDKVFMEHIACFDETELLELHQQAIDEE